jgi:hypothetical protein
MMSRYRLALATLIAFAFCQAALAAEPARYLRFQKRDKVAYGLLEGSRVRELSGDPFGAYSKAENTYALRPRELIKAA